MEDFLFDSDQLPHEPQQDSESDLQVIAEARGNHLQEQNEALTRENTKLRSQLDDAFRISSQIEEVHQKNRKLSNQLREAKNETENLSQRLEISLRTNEELSKKLEEEKNAASVQRHADTSAMQKKLQKSKEQAKTEVDTIYSQLQHLQKAKENSDVNYKLILNKVDRVIETGSHYFGADIQTIEDLLSIISQKPINTSAKTEKPAPTKNENQATLLEKKLKKERTKSKTLQTEKADLESKIEQLKLDITDTENKYKNQIKEIKAQISQQKDDQALHEAEQQHLIENLKAKVESLKDDVAQRKQTIEQLQNQQIVVRSTPAPQPKVEYEPVQPKPAPKQPKTQNTSSSGLDISSEQLIQRNVEISRQLQDVSNKREELAEKAQSLESINNQLLVELEKQKNEFQSLILVHNETKSELQMMRNALHEKETAKEKKENNLYRKEIQSQKAKIINLEKTLESQKSQIYDLTVAQQKSQHDAEINEQKVKEMKNHVTQCENKLQDTKDELLSTKKELAEKPTVTPEDVMPNTVWRYPEFDSELNTAIGKVASNSSLQPASKLQSIYRSINKYFKGLIQERDLALDEALTENQTIREAIHQFLVSTSITLSLQPITFDDFFLKNKNQELSQHISQLRAGFDDLCRKNEQLNLLLSHFHERLGLNESDDPNDVISNINGVKETIDTQASTIQKRTKKCRELTENVNKLQKKIDTDTKDYNQQVTNLKASNDQLSKKVEALSSANSSLKRELQALKAEYSDFQQLHEDNTSSMTEKYENALAEARKSQAHLENDYQDQINNLVSQLNDANERIEEHEVALNRHKKTIQAQKATIGERDDELARVKQDAYETQQNIIARADEERQQLVDSYERAVAEIRDQCDKHRNDVEKLSKSCAEETKKVKQAKEQILQLKRMKAKLEADLKSLQEQMEREKKLNDNSTKAAILSAETNCASRIDELQTKFDNEKRRIYAFVADNFKQYFSPTDTLDERSFRSVVSKTRDELQTYIASDNAIRRMIGADSRQTTDDAVAQLVMNQPYA